MTSNFQFIWEALPATAYLLFKIYIAFSVGCHALSGQSSDRLTSFMAGWLIIQTVQTGVIVVLSVFSAMTQPFFIALSTLMFAIIACKSRKSRLWNFPELSWRDLPALSAIGFVLLIMWVRSIFLYDFTWDAQVYGLPRLAIWLNAASVLVHMPTLQLNLFVNEWNAEFNALAYALVSNSFMGFAFGNFEILSILFIGIAWVARLLGASNTWAIIISAVLGSTPAMVGLASTVKGDLLAVTAFLIAVGWLIQLKQHRSPIIFFLLLISGAMAVGSKISVALPVLALFFIALVTLGNKGVCAFFPLAKWTQLAFLIGLALISSRFWVNWIIYGNPMRRIDVEKAHFSLQNMLANLELASNRLFNITDSIQGVGAMWALAGDMGGSAWFIVGLAAIWAAGVNYCRANTIKPVLVCASGQLSTSKLSTRWITAAAAMLTLTTIASMTLSLAYQWTFRYFSPGIVVLLIGIGALTLKKVRSDRQREIIYALAAVAFIANINIWMRVGEVMPTKNFDMLLTELEQANTPLKRMSLFIKGPYDIASVDALGLDNIKPLNFLIFKDLEISLIPFLGSHAQNRLQLVASGSDMLTAAANQRWDGVAVLQEANKRDPYLSVELEKQGYIVLVNNSQYIVALPKEKIELTLILDKVPLQWMPWTSPGNASLHVQNNIPEIESSNPVDLGFASQPLSFEGTTLIRAYFEGEVKGKGTHAAHLSIQGIKPIIALPAGRYTATQSHQGLIVDSVADIPRQLSFGLGGWTTGSGNLRLIRLEAYQLKVTNNETANKIILPP